MSHVLPWKGPEPRARTAQRVLYIGPSADEICNLLVNHIGRVDLAYEQEVQAAFAHMRRRQFDVVIVDQRDENLATRLILPVLQSIGYPVKPVVISTLKDVSQYLAIPGVARVLTAPVKEVQLLRVLGLERRSRIDLEQAKPAVEAPKKQPEKSKSIVQMLSDRFMNLVSTLYKRAAFVLLMALFLAFSFYGVLIGFFLISSGWGAPLTLTRGHEMVNKVEREITEVKVELNRTEQRIADEAYVKTAAAKELKESDALVKYAAGTVSKELAARERQVKLLQQAVKRLRKVQGQLQQQVDGGPAKDLEKLYKKRLINRNSFSTGTLSLIEAGQKLAAIEIEIDDAQRQIDDFDSSREMLRSLREALVKGDGLAGVTSSASDLLLLTKQSSDALAARAIAASRLKSAEDSTASLMRSMDVLVKQLAALEDTALGRARHSRVDVVFVPYGSESRFVEGTSLYSCAVTIFWCSKAGTVGKPLPGEINSVHPFFGKPIRGSFVEMKLDNPDAAMREIIHGTRKPLFF
jgi:hypothetical protein